MFHGYIYMQWYLRPEILMFEYKNCHSSRLKCPGDSCVKEGFEISEYNALMVPSCTDVLYFDNFNTLYTPLTICNCREKWVRGAAIQSYFLYRARVLKWYIPLTWQEHDRTCRSACIILTECNHLAAAQNSTEDMRVWNQRPLPQNQNKGYTIHEDTSAPAPQKSGNPILVWNSTANYQAISISMPVVTVVAIAWRIFCRKVFFLPQCSYSSCGKFHLLEIIPQHLLRFLPIMVIKYSAQWSDSQEQNGHTY